MTKKKAIIVTLAALAVVAIVVLVIVRPIGRPAAGKIAVIPLSGTIDSQEGSSLLGSTITPELVREYLGRAERDAAVKAIVLRIDSPGGTVAASQQILNEIEKVSEEKPIVVSIDNMAASGGYYISTGADMIVILPTAQTGSIGVISQIPNIEGLYDKLGIKIQTFKGGRYKDMYRGLRELTPEEEEILQDMVDEYYQHFIQVVADGRGLSTDDVRDLATGQVYSGIEASKLGLVDELGDLDAALNLTAELAGLERYVVEYYERPGLTLWSLLGLADAIQARLWGLSAQDIVLLETLSRSYPQPQFLYQG
jgi:protease-4